MQVTKTTIIKTAKTYVGTPYHHQGRLKGIGVDCCGLVICVAHELGLSTFDLDGYSPTGDGVEFLSVFRSQLEETEDPEPGNVLVFKFMGNPHCGIMSELQGETSVIHAYSSIGKVVEHRLDELWEKRILTGFKLI